MDLLVSEPRMEMVEVSVLKGEGSTKLSEVSPLAPALRERQAPRYLLRVATPKEHKNEVGEAAAEVLRL